MNSVKINIGKVAKYMGFLRWVGGVVILFWLLGFLFKIGGSMIHLLLVIAVIVFLFDMVAGRRKSKS
jgi:hypothetical protein